MIDNLKKKENLIFFTLILIFIFKLIFFPNYFNGGGDNPGYWKIISNQSSCDASSCWRELRWTIIIFGKFITTFFGDTILSYYLISSLISLFGFSLFLLFFKNNLSFYFLPFFLIFWMISIPIQSSSYDIGVVNFNLFFLIIFILFFQNFIKKENKINLLLLTVSSFFLYGITILNLLFVGFIFFFLVLKKNYSLIKYYLLFILILFVLESLFLNLSYDIGFSRLSYLLLSESSILNYCNQAGNCSNVDITKNYADGGLLTRWYFSHYNSGLLYIATFFLTIYHLFNKKKNNKNKFENINYVIYFLFFLFFISISFTFKPSVPPKSILSFADHYTAHFSLICVYIIFKFIDDLRDFSIFYKIFIAGYFLLFILMTSVGHMINYKYIFFNNDYNIFTINSYFADKKVYLEKGQKGCMDVKNETILFLYSNLKNIDKINENLKKFGLCKN